MAGVRTLKSRGGVHDAGSAGGRRATNTTDKQTKNRRSTVTVPTPVLEALREMAEASDTSIGDVTRQAVATWQWILEELNEGSVIFVRRRDGTNHELLFDFLRRTV